MTIGAITAICMLIYLILSILGAILNLHQFFTGGTAMLLASGAEPAFSSRVCGLFWLPCGNLLLFLFVFALIFSSRLRNDVGNFFRWLVGSVSASPAVTAAASSAATAAATEVVKMTATELAEWQAARAAKVPAPVPVPPPVTPPQATK